MKFDPSIQPSENGATTADVLSQVPGSVPVWGLSILGILFVILAATDNLGKILGKFGRIQQDRIANSRRAATEQDDADLKQLRRQVNNLQDMLAEEQKLTSDYRNLIVELYRYILAAQHDPSNLQKAVPQPIVDDKAAQPTATTGE